MYDCAMAFYIMWCSLVPFWSQLHKPPNNTSVVACIQTAFRPPVVSINTTEMPAYAWSIMIVSPYHKTFVTIENTTGLRYSTVESRDYAPPLCMLALGKSGEGVYTRDSNISVWRPLLTVECHGAYARGGAYLQDSTVYFRKIWLFRCINLSQ